jgi:hypothetical protein
MLSRACFHTCTLYANQQAIVGLSRKGLLTKVCIEEDAEIRPSYEEGCEHTP